MIATFETNRSGMNPSQPIDELVSALRAARPLDDASLSSSRRTIASIAAARATPRAFLEMTRRADRLLARLQRDASEAAHAELARLRLEVEQLQASESQLDDHARAVARSDIADRLERAERALLNISTLRPGDDRLDDVIHCMVSARNAARIAGLSSVADLADSVQALLDAARRRELNLTRQHLDLALEACDVIAALLESDADPRAPAPPAEQSIRGLLGALRHAATGGGLRSTASAVSDGVARIGQVLIDLGVAEPERVADALHTQRAGVHVLAERLRHAGLENAEAIETQLLAGGPLAVAIERMITRLNVIDAERLHDALQQARDSGRRLGELLELEEAELLQVMREQRRRRRAARGGLPPARPTLDNPPADPDTHAPAAPAHNIRVSASRVDALTLAIDALEATYESLAADPALARAASASVIDSLGLLGEQIRAARLAADAIRVTPLSAVLERMPRIAGELAAQSAKQIELRIDADNIDLDRRVAAQLVDPIIHLVRNACDHGVERPEIRAASGKASLGLVRIHARREGRNVVVSVRDDGAGVDRARVIEAARARGVLPPDVDPDTLSDRDVHELLFLPGFTTSHTPDPGAGVGLDLVQQHVVALGGAVEVESTPGAGACFTLRVPDPPHDALAPRR